LAGKKQQPSKSQRHLMTLLDKSENKQNSLTASRMTLTFGALAPEGAYLAEKAITRVFPKAAPQGVVEMGLFGPRVVQPTRASVRLSEHESVDIIWGAYTVPELDSDIRLVGNGTQFYLMALLEPRVQPLWKKLKTEMESLIATEGLLYKGRAVKVEFGEDGQVPQTLPPVKLSGIRPEALILNHDVQEAIDASIFAVLKHADTLRELGVPRKRGVLLEGNYGVGKTLIAGITAKHAVENGWTFLLVTNSDSLAYGFELAKRYGRTVVFVEDLDQVAHNNRDSLNTILNTIDGLDAKGEEIMIIATSNFVDRIDPAFLRPGRIDDVIHMSEPDANTRARMIQFFGGELLEPGMIPSSAILELEGATPAMVREAVERAKLRMLASGQTQLTASLLASSAESLRRQRELTMPKFTDPTPMQQLGNAVGKEISEGINKKFGAVGFF